MRRLLFTLLLLSGVATLAAQSFGWRWIAGPEGDDSTQQWFRKTMVGLQRPRQASIAIAATGPFMLYVNGRNVSAAAFLGSADAPSAYHFDVTRFLRADTNVVAVWLSPVPGSRRAGQIAVGCYGSYDDGRRFAMVSDSSWRCHRAEATTRPRHGECDDGRLHQPEWNQSACLPYAWGFAREVAPVPGTMPHEQRQVAAEWRVRRILSPESEQEGPDGVTFDFGEPFTGWVRITLRGAAEGEAISIGNFTYICRNATDEQACRRFTTGRQRLVTISGDKHFTREQIQSVEGLEIEAGTHQSYLY